MHHSAVSLISSHTLRAAQESRSSAVILISQLRSRSHLSTMSNPASAPPASRSAGPKRPRRYRPPQQQPAAIHQADQLRDFHSTSPRGDTRFRDIPGLSPSLLKALPFETCTEVCSRQILYCTSPKEVGLLMALPGSSCHSSSHTGRSRCPRSSQDRHRQNHRLPPPLHTASHVVTNATTIPDIGIDTITDERVGISDRRCGPRHIERQFVWRTVRRRRDKHEYGSETISERAVRHSRFYVAGSLS